MQQVAMLVLVLSLGAISMFGQYVTAGRRFIIAMPPYYREGFSNNARVLITAASDSVTVTFRNMQSGVTQNIRTGKRYEATLRESFTSTSFSSFYLKLDESEQILNRTFEITADADITVHVRRVSQSDGWRPVPVHLWGLEYRAVSYYDNFAGTERYPGGFIVIASEDNTDVAIALSGPSKDIATTMKGRRVGDTIRVTLQKGQCYFVTGNGATKGSFDLSGSHVRASRPVMVTGFHLYATVPLCPQDPLQGHPAQLIEDIPPLHAWAKEYVTLAFIRKGAAVDGRGSGDPYRIVASQDSTKWSVRYYDRTTKQLLGQDSGMIPSAGAFATIQSCTPAVLPKGVSVWTADKPVMLMHYSASHFWDGEVECHPFMIAEPPTAQLVQECVVQWPSEGQGDCKLNLIVQASSEEDLKTLTIGGRPVWSHPDLLPPGLLDGKVPGKTDLYVATLTLRAPYLAAHMTSNGRVSFAGTVYRESFYESTGYPVAGYLGSTASSDTIAPVVKVVPGAAWAWTAHDEGGSGIGGVHLFATSRNASLNFGANGVPGYEITRPVHDASGYIVAEQCDSTVVADLIVWDFAWNRTHIRLTRAPVLLGLPEQVHVGAHLPGTQIDTAITVRNQGADTVYVARLTVEGSSAFTARPLSGPIAIPPGDSAQVTVTYTAGMPGASGVIIDEAIVRINECSNVTVPLRGIAAVPRISVTDRADPNNVIGVGATHCDTQCVLVKNTSPVPATIMSVSMRSHDEIALSDNPMIEFTLQPGETKTVGTICYSPASEGADTTMLTVTTSGPGATAWNTLIRRRCGIPSSVTEPLDLPSDVTIIDDVVYAREHMYTVTVYDLLGRTLFTGTVRPGEGVRVPKGYTVVQKP